MEIHIAKYPSPMNYFLISIEIASGIALTFQNTRKAERIIKQKLIEKKKMQNNARITDEWKTIVINNAKFDFEYNVRWIDLNYKDWINDEIWETVWEKPLSKKLSEALLHYSRIISDNYDNIEKIKEEISKFEELISDVIAELKSKENLS